MKAVLESIAKSLLLLTVLMAACKNTAVKAEIPAIVVEPTTASRAELSRIVTEALHGVEVTLADDALTHNNLLVIERKPITDANGNRVQGRELGSPEQFQLFIDNEKCVLVQRSSNKRWRLQNTQCKPAE